MEDWDIRHRYRPSSHGLCHFYNLSHFETPFHSLCVIVFEGKYGKVIAPNITSHSDALGRYNDFELKRIIKDGITPNGNRLNSEIMPLYNRMDDGDLDALIAYLRTIPPLVPEEE